MMDRNMAWGASAPHQGMSERHEKKIAKTFAKVESDRELKDRAGSAIKQSLLEVVRRPTEKE
jgi:hypothetical protein